MSTISVNFYLITLRKTAITAKFNDYSLLFVNKSRTIMDCIGVCCESDISLYFLLMHDQVNISITHIIFADIPTTSCISSLEGEGAIYRSRLFLRDFYE